MRRTVVLLAAFVIALGLAGCGDDDSTNAATETTTTTAAVSSTTETTAAAGAAAAVTVADSKIGPILVDADGMTVYFFKPDTEAASACNEGCAQAWPPLTATGTPTGGTGVDASLLKTAPRPDGSTQVVYNGHRLYRYSGDKAVGDTTGNGVGGIWFAVTAAGEAAPASS